jgi:hypothetical protein
MQALRTQALKTQALNASENVSGMTRQAIATYKVKFKRICPVNSGQRRVESDLRTAKSRTFHEASDSKRG